MIFDSFARRHPEALRDKFQNGARSTPINFYGVGGFFDTRPYEIADLQLGNMHFTDFVGYRVTSNQSFAGNWDGLIGERFLPLFTVGLDYGDSRVYLVPNDDARRAMTH
jgi:hypothetical protein